MDCSPQQLSEFIQKYEMVITESTFTEKENLFHSAIEPYLRNSL